MFDGATCTDPHCIGCEFDAVEARFAEQVGRYLTNFVANGNPNDDTRGAQSNASARWGGAFSPPAPLWPAYSASGDSSIVLEPQADGTPGYVEQAIGRAPICKFWGY